MEIDKFDVDKAVDWFFEHYKEYGIECMPNHVGKIPAGADELTFNLLDAIKAVDTEGENYKIMTYSEMIASIIEVLESEDLSESSKEKLTEVVKQLSYQWHDSLSIFF